MGAIRGGRNKKCPGLMWRRSEEPGADSAWGHFQHAPWAFPRAEKSS